MFLYQTHVHILKSDLGKHTRHLFITSLFIACTIQTTQNINPKPKKKKTLSSLDFKGPYSPPYLRPSFVGPFYAEAEREPLSEKEIFSTNSKLKLTRNRKQCHASVCSRHSAVIFHVVVYIRESLTNGRLTSDDHTLPKQKMF